jgi:hypothetical protein
MSIFKQIKSSKEHLLKKTALAEVAVKQTDDGKDEVIINIKKGGLSADQLKEKGSKLFEQGMKMKLRVTGGNKTDLVGSLNIGKKKISLHINKKTIGVQLIKTKQKQKTKTKTTDKTEVFIKYLEKINTNASILKSNVSEYDDKSYIDKMEKLKAAYKKVEAKIFSSKILNKQLRQKMDESMEKIQRIDSNYTVNFNEDESEESNENQEKVKVISDKNRAQKKIFLKFIKKLIANAIKLKENISKYDDKPLIKRMEHLGINYTKLESKIKSSDMYDDFFKKHLQEAKNKIQQIDSGYEVSFKGNSTQNTDNIQQEKNNDNKIKLILNKLEKLEDNTDKLKANISKYDDKPLIKRIDILAEYFLKISAKTDSLGIKNNEISDKLAEIRLKIKRIGGSYKVDLGPELKKEKIKTDYDQIEDFFDSVLDENNSEEDLEFYDKEEDSEPEEDYFDFDDDSGFEDEQEDFDFGDEDESDFDNGNEDFDFDNEEEFSFDDETNDFDFGDDKKTIQKSKKKVYSRPRSEHYVERITRLSEAADKLKTDISKYDDQSLIDQMKALALNYTQIAAGLNNENLFDDNIKKILFEARDKIQDIDPNYHVSFGSIKSKKPLKKKVSTKADKKVYSRPRRDYFVERINRLSEAADKLKADISDYDDQSLIDRMEALGLNYKKITVDLNKENMFDDDIKKILFEARDKIQDIDPNYHVSFGSKKK